MRSQPGQVRAFSCDAGNIDLNGWLVRRGRAVAYWRYSLPEIMAHIEGVDVARGFRAPGRLAAQPSPLTAAICPEKEPRL